MAPVNELPGRVLTMSPGQSTVVLLLKKWGWLFYLTGITLLLGWLFRDWAYDDPFITYRYAANLAQGFGMVYNPGERILSTTTLLWSLMLAPFSALRLDLQAVAVWLGSACLGIGGLSLWKLGEASGQRWMGWAGLLLYPLHPLVVTSLGSETPLYLALILGTLALATAGRHRWAACLAGLAVLARPDGLLVPLVLGVVTVGMVLWRRGMGLQRDGQRLDFHQGWQALLIFCAVVAPVWGWAWVYYGSPLPVTLAVKQQQGLMAISDLFLTGFRELLSQYWAVGHWRILLLLAGVGWAYSLIWMCMQAVSPRRAAQSNERIFPMLLLMVWSGAYFAAYVLLEVSRYFWYYAPLAPAFAAGVGLCLDGVWRLWHELVNRLPNPAKVDCSKRVVLAGIVCLAGLLLVFALFQLRDISRIRRDPRMPVYRQVGIWLKTNTPAEARVGLLEAGVIGYYAQRSVVDFAGLIQPRTALQLTPETTYEDTALWAVATYELEYLVLHDGLFPRLEAQIQAGLGCREVQRFAGLQVDMVVYSCNR